MIVVDSSAVIDALAATTGTEDLRAYLAGEDLHAPSLLDFEIVSVLRRFTRTGEVSSARAQDLLTDFDELPVHRWASVDALRRRAFQLRENVSAYDASYVALAEALECPLLTRDSRLSRSSGHKAQIEVR